MLKTTDQNNIDPIGDTFLLPQILKSYPSLAVIINNIGSDQAALEFLHEGYNFLNHQCDIELIYFTQTWDQPMTAPPSGLYHIKHLMNYRGHVICPSIDGVIDSFRIGTIKNILWYIYTPTEIQRYNEQMMSQMLTDNRIIRVCRSENHKKIILSKFPNAVLYEKNFAYPNIAELYNILDNYE